VSLDPAVVSAMAAVFGSFVGGSATVVTAWVTQKTLSKRELIGAEIRQRETLYGEFIRECSKCFAAAVPNRSDDQAGLAIRSRFISDWSVVRFTPKRAAAPLGPAITQ
jgi:hypothetical protein